MNRIQEWFKALNFFVRHERILMPIIKNLHVEYIIAKFFAGMNGDSSYFICYTFVAERTQEENEDLNNQTWF